MGVDIDAKMIVGVYYDDLPKELRELDDDDLYDFIENNGLNTASLYYDSGIDGKIIGRTVNNDVPEEDLGCWLVTVKQAFKEVESILKVKPNLIATQHVW